MITGIQIKNFKGIGDPGIKIDLAPVTLLFGVNNAGKSSVFHAFMLADELCNRGNRNPSRIGPEGSPIDLGGFESFVNDQDTSKPIELSFSLDLSRVKLDKEWPIEESLIALHGEPAGIDLSTIGDDIWNAEISIVLKWNEKTREPYVAKYGVSLNDEPLLEIACAGPGSVVYPTNVNPAHSLFRWPEGSEPEVGIDTYGILDALTGDFQQPAVQWFHLGAEFSVDELPFEDDEGLTFHCDDLPDAELVEVRVCTPHEDYQDWPNDIQEAADELGEYAPEIRELELYLGRYADGRIRLVAVRILTPIEIANEEEREEIESLPEHWFSQLNYPHSLVSITSLSDALPNWYEPIQFKFPFSDMPEFESVKPRIRLVSELLNRLTVGPGRILARELEAFRHIGPLRRTPDRAYQLATFSDHFRWADGLAAWDALLHSRELTEQVSDWIQRGDRLGLGYEIDFQEYREVPVDSPITRCFTGSDEVSIDTLQIAAELFEALPIRTKVRFRPENSRVYLQPQDLAVGLNQVLPVIVAALDNHEGLTFIEQPELHNHPSVEVGLGDLFAQSTKQSNSRFILETHGEHLTLRLLRRIRQTNDEELPDDVPSLTPEDIAVYFIGRDGESTTAKQLRIDESGEFIDPWPGGFFDERAEELFG
ncbi:DUF3696 domain-containing protein [Rhodopirellula sp. JC639]|uniref:DUF3696 domain-containing protein n=1 Tax=Stieleria mannarensis TaxID=2755585 RepID=UPI0016037EDD|nr:DUF3696 domain-containing protein [Rhodopirellula sp. JC639]